VVPVPGRFMRFRTPGAACWQRESTYLQTLSLSRHRVQHVVGDGGGVEVQQADPLEAVDAIQVAEEPGRARPVRTRSTPKTSCPVKSAAARARPGPPGAGLRRGSTAECGCGSGLAGSG